MNCCTPSDNITGLKGIVYQEKSNGYKGYQGRVVLHKKAYTKRFNIKDYISSDDALKAAQAWVISVREQLHGEFARHG